MKKYYELLKIELRITFLSRLQYKVGMISDFIMIVGVFLIAFFFNEGSPLKIYYDISSNDENILFFIGFLFWQFSSLALGFSTSIVSSEASEGILEQKMQSSFKIQILYFIKLIINLLTNFLIILALIILMFFLTNLTIRDIVFFFVSIILNIPAIIGMYGIGLLLSTIVLKEKKSSSLILIVQTLLIFISNVMKPLDNIIVALIPYSLGIEICRKIYLELTVGWELWLGYICINLFWIMIGSFLFGRALKIIRREGAFDTY